MGKARIGGLRAPPTVYVDSSPAGDDANNGATPTFPKKTIAAVRAMSLTASSIIALRCEGYWRENFYGLPDGLTITNYGAGKAPVLDSSDLATSWSATAGRTNVWETTWTRDYSAHASDGTVYLLLWEDDVQLPGAASVDACESTAGSFYHDENANKVYYHPTNNANPSTHVINITKRPEGIYAFQKTGVIIEGIHARRPWAHYGGISNGPGGITRRTIVDGAGLHHMVLADGLVEDTVFLETSPRHTGGTTPIAFYQPDPTAKSALARRLFMIGAPATKSIQGGFYAHGMDSAHPWKEVIYDQCYVSYGYGPSADAVTVQVLNNMIENASAGIIMSGVPTIKRTLLRNCTGVGSVPAMSIVTGGATVSNVVRTVENSVVYLSDALTDSIFGFRMENQRGQLILTNCIVHLDLPLRSGGAIYCSTASGQSLQLIMNGCIVVVPKGGFPAIQLASSDVTYAGNHNVFVRTDGSPSSVQFVWQGANLLGLTNWRSATGQDAHSVYLSTAQQATFWLGVIANGDFRVNPANAVTDADGTIYSGTFPDGMLLSTAGLQEYFNWNTRLVTAGPTLKWARPPQTLAEADTYIAAPAAWNFY